MNKHSAFAIMLLRCAPKPRLIISSTRHAPRYFTTTVPHHVRSIDLSKEQLSDIKVNRKRLWEEIHETCEFGKAETERWGPESTDTGMYRLALSDSDKQARDWFITKVKSLGCQAHIDKMGNIFAIRPGRLEGAPTYSGSHLDTQPNGGRYDGILGVHAGLEVLQTMNENNIETEYPCGVINWTNEEGARFPHSMVSSGVWQGDVPLSEAHALKEVGSGNATQKSELERIGYLGDIEASYVAMPIGAHFELHIEQGPILEASGKKVGVVQGVQAYSWSTIVVNGFAAHTGTTNFSNRADALLAASKLILHSHNKASEMGCLASTGILTLKPGSVNTFPGWVQFSLDIRSPEDKKVEALEKVLKEDFRKIAAGEEIGGLNSQGTKGKGCTVDWKVDMTSPAVFFDKDCVKCVEESAEDLLGSKDLIERMTSGAGHDSVNTSKRAATSMIFAPCRNGVSHNPAEYCSPEDCGNGAQVLLGAMLRYDRLRAAKSN